MKAIIYYRKSTDRDDRQANSLEHQLENCKRTAKINSFDVIKEIGESRSAKTEGTRPGFNEMLKICKTGTIDYIIIDEAKRLSRNNLDSARIVDLFDKGQIKGIYSTGRIYLAEQINDVFLLQLDLSLSKMDNAHRSKDIREKMQTCVKNQRRFLGKAPFGYKNVTIKKGHKEIEIDKKEAKIVKEIFNYRLENKAYSTIGDILKKKYGNTLRFKPQTNRLQEIVKNKFYYGIFKWNGVEYIGSHKPIMTKEFYDLVNSIGKGVYEYQKEENEPRKARKYLLKGLIKDSSGIKLTATNKKGINYYCHQYRSDTKVNIREDLLLEKIGEYIKANEIENKKITELDKMIIINLIKLEKGNNGNDFIDTKAEIQKLRDKQEKLLDMKLDEKITEEMYIFKNNKIEKEIFDLEARENETKNDDFEAKTQILLELAGSFYRSYIGLNIDGKVDIIKKIQMELFINTKKELQIVDSPLFESSKMLNFLYGGAKRNGTAVQGVADLCMTTLPWHQKNTINASDYMKNF